MNTKTKVIIGLVIVAILAFYAGNVYGGRSSTNAGNRTGVAGMAGARGANGTFTRGTGGNAGFASGVSGMRGGSLITGNVISKDDKSVTIGINGGGSKIVFYSASTTVMKSTAGSIGDVSVNEQVVITGTANSDGSVTAQSIQIRPAGPPGPMGQMMIRGGTIATSSTPNVY